MDKLNSFQQTTSGSKRGILAIEKRRHPRFNVELPMDYSRVDGKELYGGIVANASEGGVLVYLPERIEVGSFLKIEIIYVNGLELNTIQAVAQVVWQDLATKESLGEHRYGLQFQQIDEENFVRLSSLLKEVGK
jgi:c-di-GMP-binding flagellar brake protein YcgR